MVRHRSKGPSLPTTLPFLLSISLLLHSTTAQNLSCPTNDMSQLTYDFCVSCVRAGCTYYDCYYKDNTKTATYWAEEYCSTPSNWTGYVHKLGSPDVD